MHEMISRYADLMQAGREFRDGAKVDGILDKPCVLRKVHLPWREPLLRSASWYYNYEEYPVLQCFWPDRHGYFPWEDHCSKRSRKVSRCCTSDLSRRLVCPSRCWWTNLGDSPILLIPCALPATMS